MRLGLLLRLGFLSIIMVITTFYQLTTKKYGGKIEVKRAGRSGAIDIYHDNHLIPRIYAKSLPDAYYGLGWVHAQHRLWSMHLRRMLFSGNLSQMFGPALIRVDKFVRTFGFHRAARNDLLNLDQRAFEELTAYSDGINDYVRSLTILPSEFLITKTAFQLWKPVDSLVFLKFMSWASSHDWVTQIFRTRLAKVFGKEKACEILACSSEYLYDNKTTILNDEDLKASNLYEHGVPRKPFKETSGMENTIYHSANLSESKTSKRELASEIEKYYFNMVNDLMNGMKGSNVWVISGKYTATGKPILANDPHYDNSMPCIWMQAEINWAPNKKVIGATIPGIPTFSVGRSDSAVWGIAAHYADTTDVYRETLNENGTQFLFEDKWYDLEEYEETISVYGGPDVNFTIHATRHGPILNDFLEIFQNQLGAPFVLDGNYSFAWTGHISSDKSFNALQAGIDFERLRDLKNNTGHVFNPPLNFVGAFINGDIFYLAHGLLPIRENQYDAAFILDGTKSSEEWTRYAAKWENPHVFNPQKGFIISANNKFASDNMKNNLSRTQTVTPRAARIQELIEAQIKSGKKFTIEDMKMIQLDTVDVYARDNIGKILQIIQKYKTEILGSTNPSLEEVIQVLNTWKGTFDGESIGASVFSVWEYLFNKKLFNLTGLDKEERGALFSHMYYDQFFFRYITKWWQGQELNASFCYNHENLNLTDIPCVWNVVHALREAYDYLKEKKGPDIWSWKWKDIHERTYNHAPFTTSLLRIFYHRNRKGAGNRRTPNVAVYYPKFDNFESLFSANLRMIASLAFEEQDLFIIDSGTSEAVFSGHYDDQLDLMLDGKYLEMSFTNSQELHKMKHHLTLEFLSSSEESEGNNREL